MRKRKRDKQEARKIIFDGKQKTDDRNTCKLNIELNLTVKCWMIREKENKNKCKDLKRGEEKIQIHNNE